MLKESNITFNHNNLPFLRIADSEAYNKIKSYAWKEIDYGFFINGTLYLLEFKEFVPSKDLLKELIEKIKGTLAFLLNSRNTNIPALLNCNYNSDYIKVCLVLNTAIAPLLDINPISDRLNKDLKQLLEFYNLPDIAVLSEAQFKKFIPELA